MKKYALILLLSLMTAAAAFAQNNIEGKWKTIGEDGKDKSIIRIFKLPDETYCGEVVELIALPSDAKCEKCEGAFKDKPILGMRVLSKLKKDGEKYVKGELLDPKAGKTYYCKASIEEKGKKLKVRGSLDSSGLIGRTQVWVRAE